MVEQYFKLTNTYLEILLVQTPGSQSFVSYLSGALVSDLDVKTANRSTRNAGNEPTP